MTKEKIEFACDIKLIRDLLNTFGEGVCVTKLNAYTILVNMETDVDSFTKWAKPNIDSITILNPSYLKDKLPHSRLRTIIKDDIK